VTVFRRKHDGGRRRAGGQRRAATGGRAGMDPGDPGPVPAPEPDQMALDGPYDALEAPEDTLPRVDLGALRVPMFDGLQMGFSRDEGSGELMSAVLADGASALELSVFAAPKSAGIWTEVRTEIVDSLREGGQPPRVTEGPRGPEVELRLPTGSPGETVPGRLMGIDGPRWFLRVVVTGEAALNPAAAPLLDAALGALVVVRGDVAMPLRDPLPLRLPPELREAMENSAEPTTGPPGPGVRITETR
jgi:hypothetical protein